MHPSGRQCFECELLKPLLDTQKKLLSQFTVVHQPYSCWRWYSLRSQAVFFHSIATHCGIGIYRLGILSRGAAVLRTAAGSIDHTRRCYTYKNEFFHRLVFRTASQRRCQQQEPQLASTKHAIFFGVNTYPKPANNWEVKNVGGEEMFNYPAAYIAFRVSTSGRR